MRWNRISVRSGCRGGARSCRRTGVVPWLVVDADGHAGRADRRFLRDFVARATGRPASAATPTTCCGGGGGCTSSRSSGTGRPRAEVRDFVLWLEQATKPRDSPRTKSAATVGDGQPDHPQALPRRPVPAPDDPAQQRGVAQLLRVLDRAGQGPLVNPVRCERTRGGRAHAHHNPLDAFRAEGRIRYNPKIPKAQTARRSPTSGWNDAVRRDALQPGPGDPRAGHQQRRPGLRAAGHAVASTWTGATSSSGSSQGQRRAAVAAGQPGGVRLDPALPGRARCPPAPNEPLWWTLRRRDRGAGLRRQPMNYEALRAVFRRVNAVLGTQLLDARPSPYVPPCGWAATKTLSLRDVQTILGHAHLSTTAEIYLVEDEAEVIRRVAEHLAERERPRPAGPAAARRRLRRRRPGRAVRRHHPMTVTTSGHSTPPDRDALARLRRRVRLPPAAGRAARRVERRGDCCRRCRRCRSGRLRSDEPQRQTLARERGGSSTGC